MKATVKIILLVVLLYASYRAISPFFITSELGQDPDHESSTRADEVQTSTEIKTIEGLPEVPILPSYMERAMQLGRSFKQSGYAYVVEEFDEGGESFVVIGLSDYSFSGSIYGLATLEAFRTDAGEERPDEIENAHIEFSSYIKIAPFGTEYGVFRIKRVFAQNQVPNDWINDAIDFRTGNEEFDYCIESKGMYRAADKLMSLRQCVELSGKETNWRCVLDGVNEYQSFRQATDSCGIADSSAKIGELCQINLDRYVETTRDDFGVISCNEFAGYQENWNCVSDRYTGGDGFYQVLNACGVRESD